MAQITRVDTVDPDPNIPPLRATVGRDDQGNYSMTIEMGGIESFAAVALLVETASTVLTRATGGPSIASHALDQLGHMLWEHAKALNAPDCPDCGEKHP